MTEFKCWKRAKSGESVRYPYVFRNKKDGDNVVTISYFGFSTQKYKVEHNDTKFGNFFESKSKALKLAKSYMKEHDKC